jgi:RES domain-containing protein
VIEIFRIHGAAYDAFDTTGTFLFPGRWHTRGTRVVYAAAHVSLAALEVLIHAEGKRLPPKMLTRIRLPEGLATEDSPMLDFAESQAFGDRWIAEKRSAALRVPSVAVAGLESNYLLNPAHQDFRRIRCDDAIVFSFDQRLLRAR